MPGNEPVLARCADGPRAGRTYPVSETRLDGNERRYLNECLDANWISSTGAFVSRFERAFAAEAGCEFGVACANGTVALHLALASLGIGRGDEVIIPAFTMIAVANACHYLGAVIRLVDVDPVHFNLQPDLVEAAITHRTKAIIAVHTYGHPADMPRLLSLASHHDIQMVEDAAEAHGAEIGRRRAGAWGRAATFSFYANKIVTTGEGGFVATNDGNLARFARRLRDHAFHPERHFWHEYIGFNYRMTNMQAAIGLAQTERLEAIVASRRQVRDWYDARLRSLPGLTLPTEQTGCRSVFWMYSITVDERFGCTAYELRCRLATLGVETRAFFVPIHAQPAYAEEFAGQRYPVAESLATSGLYLPTHPGLTEEDVGWICARVHDIHADVKSAESAFQRSTQ